LELVQTTPAAAANLFDLGTVTTATDTMTFAISSMPAGSYLVRVWIDGAESPFDLDAGGTPIAPLVTL
jgi:hypothetical protein